MKEFESDQTQRNVPGQRQRQSPVLSRLQASMAAAEGPCERVDCVVIGAGVVGLAVARELAASGREVIILESSSQFGSGISSRNSEVIHAGIYYAKDSLKSRLCVAGKQQLYAYCDAHQLTYQRCGKLIVATHSAQCQTLMDIQQRARSNGVHDLVWLDAAAVRDIEPALNAEAALLSPSTGILDSHGFMLSLLGEAQSYDAMIAYGSTACALEVVAGRIQVSVDCDEPMRLSAKSVINCAGLGAIALANTLTGTLTNRAGRTVLGGPANGPDYCPNTAYASHLPRQVLAKGNYFSLTGPSPVSRLIYPVPEVGGLGVHITLDLSGRARFGPDVEWTDEIDYNVDPGRADKFYAAIREYWPLLPDRALLPEYAGIRPKIAYGDEVESDFVIASPAEHGIAELVNLFGIESPGLTSSLALAAEVSKQLR